MRICDWSSDVCSSDLIFHTNGWQGQRQTRNHWQGDLPADEARAAFVHARGALETAGWDFRPEHTKVLIPTQRALANELGDRKRVVEGKSVSGCVDLAGCRIIKKNTTIS